MKKRYAAIFLLSLSIGGCTLYRKPNVLPPAMPSNFKYRINVSPYHLKNQWWENFNDAQLNELVNVALKNNYSYLIALKNIDIAWTYVTQNESSLFPQINLNFNASRNKAMNIFNNSNNFISSANPNTQTTSGFGSFGRTFNLFQLFATVTYEVDVWNQIRNTINQSKATLASTATDSDVIKLTLISSVVNTYFQIQVLNENLSNLKNQYEVASEILHVSKSEFRGKLIDVTTLNDNIIQMENIQINMENLRKQKNILENSLAYLLGTYPEDLIIKNLRSLNNIHFLKLIPAGIPSQVIANRPDVQSAYFQAMSNGFVEKQTIANFLPSFTLTGTYGYANTSFSHFFSSTNSFWNYGVNVLQPVFDYKLRLSEYRRAKYQFESSKLNYRNTILNAFQEVDNALTSYQNDVQVFSSYQKEALHLKNKLKVADAQYESGYGDYSIYLMDKLSALQNDYNINYQEFLIIQDVVQVYKTLGLGLSK